MKRQKGFYRSRHVHRREADREPEVDIDQAFDLKDVLMENLEKVQTEILLGAYGCPVKNTSAASPARVEKVVQGERLE